MNAQAQPFILATPHHSNTWQGQVSQAEYNEYIAQMEAGLQQLTEQMKQLDAQYQTLLAQYKAATGQS